MLQQAATPRIGQHRSLQLDENRPGDPLSTLPKEVLLLILERLEEQPLCRLAVCNSYFHAVCMDSSLWKNFTPVLYAIYCQWTSIPKQQNSVTSAQKAREYGKKLQQLIQFYKKTSLYSELARLYFINLTTASPSDWINRKMAKIMQELSKKHARQGCFSLTPKHCKENLVYSIFWIDAIHFTPKVHSIILYKIRDCLQLEKILERLQLWMVSKGTHLNSLCLHSCTLDSNNWKILCNIIRHSISLHYLDFSQQRIKEQTHRLVNALLWNSSLRSIALPFFSCDDDFIAVIEILSIHKTIRDVTVRQMQTPKQKQAFIKTLTIAKWTHVTIVNSYFSEDQAHQLNRAMQSCRLRHIRFKNCHLYGKEASSLFTLFQEKKRLRHSI